MSSDNKWEPGSRPVLSICSAPALEKFLIWTLDDADILTLWRSSMAGNYWHSIGQIVTVYDYEQQVVNSFSILLIISRYNMVQPHRQPCCVSGWWSGTVGVWLVENAASWSAISLLYIELDEQHSLTFLSGVPATHCLRLHSLISLCVGKIFHCIRLQKTVKYYVWKFINYTELHKCVT